MIQKLTEAAKRAQKNAYAPYSRFHVGAAVLADDGKIYGGCNVENASYSATICAERTAIGNAVANGAKRIAAILIIAKKDEVCPPCGICRQTLAEFGGDDLQVHLATLDGTHKTLRLGDLLPHAFRSTDLDD